MSTRGPRSNAQAITFTSGLDVASSEVDVKPNAARTLLNYSVGDDSKPELRGGRVKLNSIALPGNPRVLSIMEYISNPDSSNVVTRQDIIGTSDGCIYRISSTGVATQIYSGLTVNKRIYWKMFNGNLIMCNGVDSVLTYDGTTVTTLGGSPPAFTYIEVNNQRLWGIKQNVVYYSKLNDATNWVVSAAADGSNTIPGPVIFRGDTVISLADAGNAIVIFGKRNIAVYQTDTDRTLISKINGAARGVIAPAGIFADQIIMFWTPNGIWELQQTIQGNNLRFGDNVSKPVDPFLTKYYRIIRDNSLEDLVHIAHSSDRGWMMLLCPTKSDGTGQVFTIYNYQEKVTAWFQWDNHPVYSVYVNSIGKILAGGDSYLYELENGTTDDGGDIGGASGGIWELPSLYFGRPETAKIFTHMRIFTENSEAFTIGYEPSLDFGQAQAINIKAENISIDASGPFLDESGISPKIYLNETVLADAAGRHAPLRRISGRGFAYRPLFRYKGRVKHKFLYLNFEYKVASRG